MHATPERSVFHPSRRLYRFTVLFFASLLTFGGYFAYDSIGAMETMLMADLGIGRDTIGSMYTIYSVAAILSVFLGGILIDRIGTRRASLLFSLIATSGAVWVALSRDVWSLHVGRFVFGWGAESLIVAQNAILARWFKGRELGFAFGFGLMISRLGTLLSFNTEAMLAERFGVMPALWIAAGFCGFSLLANLVYARLDRHAERTLEQPWQDGGQTSSFGDARHFGPSFWLVCLLGFTFYSGIFPFTALSTDFFHDKWGLPLSAGERGGGFLADLLSNYRHMFSSAPGTTSIIIFASMVCAPFAGGLVDRFGRRASLMLIGALLMIPSYLLMGFTHLTPAIPMVVLGLAFVLVPAAMWPSIPHLVDKRRIGTAFGMMNTLQNVGLAIFPWVNGGLREASGGYAASMVMFATLAVVGAVLAWMLLIQDRRNGRVLEGH